MIVSIMHLDLNQMLADKKSYINKCAQQLRITVLFINLLSALSAFSRYIVFFIIRSSRLKVYCKKVFLEISQNSQENTCARVSFLIKLQAQSMWCRCFPVNFAKFLRTLFFTQNLWWLLLLSSFLLNNKSKSFSDFGKKLLSTSFNSQNSFSLT